MKNKQTSKTTRQQKTLSVGIWPIGNCTSPNTITGIWEGNRGKHLSVLIIFSKNPFCPFSRRRQTEKMTVGECYLTGPATFLVVLYSRFCTSFSSWISMCVLMWHIKQTGLLMRMNWNNKQTFCSCAATLVSVWENLVVGQLFVLLCSK